MKKLLIFTPVFIASLIIFTITAPIVTLSEDISTKVFRLHIVANSDSEEDQELKIKVKDKVLIFADTLYENCQSVSEAKQLSKQHLTEFESIAQKTVAFYGYDYEVKAYTINEYFSTRKYDNFTLPAGMYDSLKIVIGNGKGKNWWCVMFPSVCLSGCTDDFNETLTDEERKVIESNNYKVRFKAVEIYEKIKSELEAE